MLSYKYPGSRLQSAAGSARNCRERNAKRRIRPAGGTFLPHPGKRFRPDEASLHCRRGGAPVQTQPPMHNDVRFALPAQLQGAFAPKK